MAQHRDDGRGRHRGAGRPGPPWAILAPLTAVLLAGGGYVGLSAAAPVPAVAAVPLALEVPQPTPVDFVWPEAITGALAFADEPEPFAEIGAGSTAQLASIVKVVTALAVLRVHPLAAGEEGPSIEMGPRDVEHLQTQWAMNGSWLPVASGWTFTQRELLAMLLLGSANNYASSLVDWAFGSEEAYLAELPALLAGLGVTDTVIDSASGLSHDTVGTAADAIRIGRAALAEPVIAELVAHSSFEVPYIGDVTSTNALLGVLGIDGIKTGTLDYANLLFSADLDTPTGPRELIGVVLGSPSRGELSDGIVSLVAQVEQAHQELRLLEVGTVVAEYRPPWGEPVLARADQAIQRSIWAFASIQPRLELTPAEEGRRAVGEVVLVVSDGRELLAAVRLDEPIAGPDLAWRLQHPELAFGVIGAWLGLVPVG